MSERPERSNYWNNQYLEYWKNRVKEGNSANTNSSLVTGDCSVASDFVYQELIDQLNIQSDETVLELGCGFGRSIPFLNSISKEIIAIDISTEMIAEAKNNCRDIPNVRFIVGEAEDTGLPDNFVDCVVCFAVFDALFQIEGLIEMNRILIENGRVLITGKNNFYHEGDRKALIAERNARQKGHPNYYTDTRNLLKVVPLLGFALTHERYFEYRGDLTKNVYTGSIPDQFYEYAFILTKTGENTGRFHDPVSFSMSRTFRDVGDAL